MCVCICLEVVSGRLRREWLTGLMENVWLDDLSAGGGEIKVPRLGFWTLTSCLFRRRRQLDDLIFRGLADDVFVFPDVSVLERAGDRERKSSI